MAIKKNGSPHFRFSGVGISVGAVLSSKYDVRVKCTVVRDRYVKYGGKEMTWTAATEQMLNRMHKLRKFKKWSTFPRGLRPALHWRYDGKLLSKLYNEAYCLQGGEETFEGPPEGAVRTIQVNRYERDPKNRKEAIDRHGTRCFGCGKTMEEVYGEIAKGFIHIHHVKPISTVRGNRPNLRDLVPLCPNCHAVVHLEDPPVSIPRLKKMIKAQV